MIIERKLEGRDKLRIWDENIHSNIYQVDKKGPTEQNRQLYQTNCNNLGEEKTEKEQIYVDV